MNFESLLEYESQTPELLEFTCHDNQMLLWPIVRFSVLQEGLNYINSFDNPHAQNVKTGLWKKIKWAMLTLIRNPVFSKTKRVAIFGSNVVNMLENGLYNNRLYDHVINMHPDKTTLIESSFRFEYRSPRAVKVAYGDILGEMVRLLSFFYKVSEQDIITVDSFLTFLKSTYPIKFDDAFYEVLRKKLLNACRLWYPLKKVYLGFCRLKKIQTVIMEDASYGYLKAIIMYHLNTNGIRTIEFQHGLVALNHPAYNFPPAVCTRENKYHLFLPQYFATFGQYWSDNIRTASKKHIIGFPYLLKKAALVCKRTRPCVLVISDGLLPQLNLDICNALVKKFNGEYSVILKLHPGEVPLLNDRYSSLLHLETVSIKTYESVYDLLSSVSYVVGHSSTVMLEALAFGINPYVLRSDYTETIFNQVPFNYFDTMEELVEKIKNESSVEIDISYYWADNSDLHIQSFFKETGVL